MKIPAAFAPKSWEMPPGFVVLEESASVVSREFDGEKLDWLVALVNMPLYDDDSPIYWTRPMDAKFDAGFIIAGAHNLPLTLGVHTEPYVLRATLATVWKNNRLSRQFFLNEFGELLSEGEAAHETVVFASNGTAAWSSGTSEMEQYKSIEFAWSAPLSNVEFLRKPALELWEKMKILLADSNGEAQFSRRFGAMNEQEQRNVVYSEGYGSKEMCEELLKCVALRQDVWDEMPENALLKLSSNNISGNRLYCYHDNWGEPLMEDSSFQIDAETVRSWFFPVNEELAKKLCVAQWLRTNGPRFEIEVSRPTAHEQLEAQLRWREWKENHEKL